MSRRVAIAGVALSEVGRVGNATPYALIAQASRRALSMLARGAFDTDVLISDHIPLDRLIEDGLEQLLHHADRQVKILVDPA